MLQLKYPGVYTQEIPSGVRTVSGAPTSVALFVGPTRAGIDARPIRILNFGDFERGFGGLTQTSLLSYSVLHFFANGGGEAFVIRVPAKNSKPAKTALKRDDGGTVESLTLTALSSGTASSDIFVELDPFGIGVNPFSTTPAHDKKQLNVTVIDRLTGRVERFGNVSTSSTNARFASNVVNDPATGSKLVKIDVASAAVDKEGPQASGTIYKLGTPAAAGVFSSDIELRLTVAVLNPDGTANTTGSLTNLPVKVFKNGDAKPASTLELVTRLAAAQRRDPRHAGQYGSDGRSDDRGRLLRRGCQHLHPASLVTARHHANDEALGRRDRYHRRSVGWHVVPDDIWPPRYTDER